MCMAALTLNATTYHVAGSMNGWSHEAMTQDATDGNVWTFEFTAEAKTYEFKVTDGTWGGEEYNASAIDAASPLKLSGSNNILVTPNAGEVVITFNASSKKVSATMKNGDNPDPSLPVETKYYVAGTLPGCEWNPSSQVMTHDAADKDVWRYTFTAEAKTYEFKITEGNWDAQYNSNNIDENSAVALSANGENIQVTFAAGEASVIFNAATKKISATGQTGETPAVAYYIKHPFENNNWEWRQLTADDNGTTWSLNATYGGSGCNWNTEASDANATWVAEPALVGNPATGDRVTFTLDPAAGTITITKSETPAVEQKYYVAGEMNGWSQEAMTQDTEKKNLWYYTFTAKQDNVTFKVCSQANWGGTNWGKDNSTDGAAENYPTNCKTGDEVKITFDADLQQISVALTTVSTGLQSTTTETTAIKMIRNGVVYILREGVLYTTGGQIAQ